MSNIIEISGRKIGQDQPCFIIAEGCDNHLGNMDTAREMVRQAKACGADAIKFQHHLPDEEMLREGIPMSKNFNMPLYDFLKLYALTLDQHVELMQYCEELSIIYLCTPFSRKAAEELNEIGVKAFKIGSGEMTDLPTLKRIVAFGKPVILSSGMSVWDEIDETINTLKPLTDQLALMNCVSEYPARYEDINLGVIPQLQARYQIPIGHSDHTPDIYTCFGAVAQGAKLLEKHIILDRRQPGPDQSVSIEPYELYQLVLGTRRIEVALGTEKKIHDEERVIRAWALRSVVSIAPIPAGTIITEEHIWTKRPGTGIPARHLESILGRTAKVDIPKDHLLAWDELN